MDDPVLQLFELQEAGGISAEPGAAIRWAGKAHTTTTYDFLQDKTHSATGDQAACNQHARMTWNAQPCQTQIADPAGVQVACALRPLPSLLLVFVQPSTTTMQQRRNEARRKGHRTTDTERERRKGSRI